MRASACAVIGVLLVAGAAQATTVPDITAMYITVSYNAGTRVFTAVGKTYAFDLDGIAPPDYYKAHGLTSRSGSFSIFMHLNADGSLDYGTLTVDGNVPALSANSGTLLTGSITEFSYTGSPVLTVFDLGISGLGGDLSPYFQPKAEVVLSSYFSVDVFTPNRDYASASTVNSADVMGGAVPEPVTVAGVLLGLSGLGGYLRRRLA